MHPVITRSSKPSLPAAWLSFIVLTAAVSAQTPPAPASEESAQAPKKEETKAAELIPALEIEKYEVLGSRVRHVQAEGPSPVSVYDREYIYSTGAMTLADFLNYLPQTYSGISTGRGSAPNELNPEFGQRTETTLPAFNFVLGSSAAPPGQTGVSGVSLRGLGSGSTLVLVDGRRVGQSGSGNRSTDTRQGFVDLNSIPFSMIDRVEVITDGASAIYGADAVAGVINIILKKNWTGSELTGSYKGSEHGGGRERSLSLTSGFAYGKLRGMVSAGFYDRATLKASQRDFSKNQDHTSIIVAYNPDGTPIYGRDLRLNWGYPGVVQARIGDLNGITDANGNPTRFAIINPGITGQPTLADFTGVAANSASTLVRGNTAEYLDLIPWSERYNVAGNLTYRINERVELFTDYSFTDNRGRFETQPALASASASSGFGNFATIVPAAYNPFGQDILVGGIHAGFGSISQETHSKAHRATFGVRGEFAETWEWDAAVRVDRQRFNEIGRDFNTALITAALANPDDSKRLNPFLDVRAGASTQADIYETMALYPTRNSKSELLAVDLNVNGELFDIWGGPVQLAVGGIFESVESKNSAVSYTVAVSPIVTRSETEADGDSYAAYAEVSVPIFGKPNAIPGFQRLDLHFAGRYEDYDRTGHSTVPRVGVTWAPVQSILLRGSYSEAYRAPDLTEYQIATSTSTSTLTDPRRTPANTPGIVVTRGSNPFVLPETSTTEFYGIVVEPPFAKGLSIYLNYYHTESKDVVQLLSAQAVLNNEALFPGRVTRADPDADDIAANQPGRVTAVDQTFVNFGRVNNESADLGVNYDLPWQQYGRWRVVFSASRTIDSSRQLAPGQPAISDESDTYAPPKWKYNASLFWNYGNWNASLFGNYLDGFNSNLSGNSLTSSYPIPSVYKVDLRAGYTFNNGVFRGRGKGLRVSVGIGNLFDEEPPFSDTVFGYNGGLHSQWVLGRTYELSFILPF